uniref:CENP-V/GFA domain-containing protein n=1 Tax=Coccidioides posadasii RMSCC 3488 TaxID=454284 RepID=A0A0J6IKC7_COCPO|nr:hypothetical protein CPAG_08686 [Coccidioides posadasii RMSCC 3488]
MDFRRRMHKQSPPFSGQIEVERTAKRRRICIVSSVKSQLWRLQRAICYSGALSPQLESKVNQVAFAPPNHEFDSSLFSATMSTVRGQCHCGQIEWTVKIYSPMDPIHSHCDACKEINGGKFTLNQVMPEENSNFEKGNSARTNIRAIVVRNKALNALNTSSPIITRKTRALLLPHLLNPHPPPPVHPGAQILYIIRTAAVEGAKE